MQTKVPRAGAIIMKLSHVKMLSNSRSLFSNPNYKAAKKGCPFSARALVSTLAIPFQEFRFFTGFVCPVMKPQGNRIPQAMAEHIVAASDSIFYDSILLMNQRSGSTMGARILYTPDFNGPVLPGNYILVDDFFTTGTTLIYLKRHIENHGGNVVNAVVLSCSAYGHNFEPSKWLLETLIMKFPNISEYFDLDTLCDGHIRHLLKYSSLQSFYNRYCIETSLLFQ